MRVLIVFKTLFKRHLIELRRYYFDTISGIVTLFALFVIIFYGARALIGGRAGYGASLSGLVVGYMVWMLAIFAYSDMGFGLVQEAQTGTLEQVSMSPVGLTRVMVLNFAAGIAYQLLTLFVLLFLMMAVSGRWLHLDMVSIVPLLLLTVAGIQGIGFVVGGLALVFKRIQSSLQVLQFAFVALIAAPLTRFPWFKFLPLSWGNRLLGDVMIHKVSIFSMSAADLGFLLANSAAWLGLGVLAFRYFEKAARRRALLGHY